MSHKDSNSDSARRGLIRAFSLTFPDESMEQEWRHHDYLRSRRQLQVAAGIAFLIFATYGGVDRVVLPPGLAETNLWPPRLTGAGAMAVVLLLSLFEWFERIRQQVVVTAVLTAIGVLTWMWLELDFTTGTPMHASIYWFYHNGIVLIVVYSFLLLRLRFQFALTVAGVTMALYVVLATFVRPAPEINLITGISVLFVLVMSLFLAYVLESMERRTYRQGRLIEQQRRDLEDSLEQLRTTQRQLIQSEKMASLGQLASGIAHEIRNPLNFVANFAAVSDELLTELGSDVDVEARNDSFTNLRANAQLIRKHVNRADEIVRRLIEHASRAGGVPELCDLNDLVAAAAEATKRRYEVRIESPELSIRLHDRPLPATVVSKEISKVVANLVENALHSVTVKRATTPDHSGLVVIKTSVDDHFAVIEVLDNGTGIPDDVRHRIFEPFFTTRAPGEGTGLGLFLCYQIVNSHGGEIRVGEGPGHETKFEVRLPLTAAEV